MKLNETVIHYLGYLLTWSLFIAFALIGWQLVDHSEWFAKVWASELNRWVILITLTMGSGWLILYAYSYFWGTRKLIRTFKAVDKSNIKDCQDGQIVRVQGKLALIEDHLIAPYTKRPCAAYTLRISEKVERVKHNGSRTSTETAWETFKFFEAACDFLLHCDDHYALIKANSANIVVQPDSIHDDSSYSLDAGGFLNEEENTKRKQTLEAVGEPFRRFTGVYGEDVKFEEGVLEPNEQVAVLGTGRWVDTKNADTEVIKYLNSLSIDEIYVIESNEHQALYISDSTKLLQALNSDMSKQKSPLL